MWYVVEGLVVASGLWAMAHAITNVAKAIERSNRLKLAQLTASGIQVENEAAQQAIEPGARAMSGSASSASIGSASASR